jgi:pimeloyl-ACP methyl ester carboxylesterase
VRLTGEGLSIRPSDNIEMLRKFAADPMVIKETRIDAIYGLVNLMDAAQDAAPDFTARSLILYGLHDEIVPEDPTFTMIDHLPEFDPPRHTVAVYRNGSHMLMRDLQGEVVIEDVLAWMEHPGRPLPSGADRRGGEPTKDVIPPPAGADKQHAPGLLPGVERP